MWVIYNGIVYLVEITAVILGIWAYGFKSFEDEFVLVFERKKPSQSEHCIKWKLCSDWTMIWCVSMKILLECLMTLKACFHIRWEVIVRFVDIGRIDDHYCFKLSFHNTYLHQNYVSIHLDYNFYITIHIKPKIYINPRLNQTWRWSVLLWWKLCNF